MADYNVIQDTSGDSSLQGTTDPDAFVFGRNHGTDVITDFANGEDVIDLSAFAVFGFSDLTLTSDDNGVTIDLTEYGGGTILLQDIGIDDLDTSNFLFSHLDGGGTSADDILQADDNGDRVEGGGGADVITGGAGGDILTGGTGDDTLSGGAGDDVLEGGTGDDTLYGGENHDILRGYAGDDEIHGDAGDDTLTGHEGDDTLFGGAGDDTMFGDGGADTFVFLPGHGNDVIGDFTDGEDKIDLTGFAGISGFDDLTVTGGDDGVTVDLTEHGGGTILLEGFTLDDLDAGDFTFSGGGSEDFVYGTNAADRFLGDGEDDRYDGAGGHDTIFGGGGEDTLRGGEGEDSILGGAGDDVLYGGGGGDWLVGGNDNDELYGGEDNDRLVDGAGDDTLYGGAGDDTLSGGVGNDVLHGGTDSDIFLFAAGEGDDTVKDFTDGEDLIDLTQISGIAGFDDLTITADGTTAVLDLTGQGGGTIRLENVDVANLGEEDFQFYEPPVEVEVDGM